jgi:hypothetical protein
MVRRGRHIGQGERRQAAIGHGLSVSPGAMRCGRARMVVVDDAQEMFRTLPWPFEGDVFPSELGAVVQRTVLEGRLPALIVGHAAAGDWYVGDGINDPNVPGACVATHIAHAIAWNSTIQTLATLPPGSEARRRSPDDPWHTEEVHLPD